MVLTVHTGQAREGLLYLCWCIWERACCSPIMLRHPILSWIIQPLSFLK